jgi:hypothetical protein
VTRWRLTLSWANESARECLHNIIICDCNDREIKVYL